VDESNVQRVDTCNGTWQYSNVKEWIFVSRAMPSVTMLRALCDAPANAFVSPPTHSFPLLFLVTDLRHSRPILRSGTFAVGGECPTRIICFSALVDRATIHETFTVTSLEMRHPDRIISI
jgi:hypothetical protein